MKNLAKPYIIVFLVIGAVVGLAWANKACQPYGDPNIMVSPNTLVLHSPCKHLTIHSNIPFNSVETATVTVDGREVPATFWADDCGDLVARVTVDNLGDLEAGDLEITLSGVDGGGAFTASEIITVRE